MTDEGVARHESRHIAAALLLGVQVEQATIVPDSTSYGRVHTALSDIAISEYTDQEAHDQALISLVGHLDSPDVDWPPDWPANTSPITDERHLALYADRLGLNEPEWKALSGQALKLATSDDFLLLEEALTAALLRDRVLNRSPARTCKERHVHISNRSLVTDAQRPRRVQHPRRRLLADPHQAAHRLRRLRRRGQGLASIRRHDPGAGHRRRHDRPHRPADTAGGRGLRVVREGSPTHRER